MLALYRQALRLRRGKPDLADGPITWLEAPAGVLAFGRGPGFACVLNLSAEPVALPAHERILLASSPLSDGLLAPDTAVWLGLSNNSHESATNR
jgi:alpha-glucosidase